MSSALKPARSLCATLNKDGLLTLTLHFECSRLTTSGWVYRSDNTGNATLRNANGYWGDHNVHSETATIHCT